MKMGESLTSTREIRWHLGHLDALRGIAVLGVVMVHYSLSINIGYRASVLAFTGQRGVQLFFMVSAFTLFMSYENRRDEHNPNLNFFLRRLFRILPMFYVATAVACLLMPQHVGPRRGVILSLLFLNGFVPRAINRGAGGGWSVATEVIFYMCLPLLFRTVRNLTAAMWVLLISTPVLYFACPIVARHFPDASEYYLFLGFPVEFPIFAAGIAIYFLWKEQIRHQQQADTGHKQISILLLCLAIALYRVNLPFNDSKLYSSSLVCALLLVALSIHPWPLFVNRATIFLGKISFSIYLLHGYLLWYFAPLVWRQVLHGKILAPHGSAQAVVVLGITFATTVLLSTLAWMYIETPGIRLGRRLIAHIEKRALKKKNAELVPPFRALAEASNSPDAQF
jgi:peptidoglycan/LPS O-acetylase OafA/YrhL